MSLESSPRPHLRDPDVQDGIKYWESQPANYDGVLGGFGNGTLPRVDPLGSRQFLMHLLPELCLVPSAVRPLNVLKEVANRRTRALDVGAGVGRVTADVLLHLFSDVVLVEPVEPFVNEAFRRGKASGLPAPSPSAPAPAPEKDSGNHLEVVSWKGIADKTKSVTFVQATLQDFDPTHPALSPSNADKVKILGRVGYVPSTTQDDLSDGFDVVMCQWCLGALSDADLVAFFRKCKAALRDPTRGLIFVKENLCSEEGSPRVVFDESDSSLTRSDLAWKKCFANASLKVIREQIQNGFPEGLYPVKMCVPPILFRKMQFWYLLDLSRYALR
ncbi:AdoMet dependent proline di-methyltransferase-domain-containing protein [Ganoderma leucocontextum]|nr:AdoMet dependent proline di-methyltransferase-domain-containing protein [Ganoderma leucocontextum]